MICSFNKYLKHLLLSGLLVFKAGLFVSGIFAQDPVMSQFMFGAVYSNPAHAGIGEYSRIMAGHRNQWPGVENAAQTIYVSADTYVDALSGGVGLHIMHDKIADGQISELSADLIYSHPVKISPSVEMVPGIGFSFVQKKYSPGDPSMPSLESKVRSKIDVNAGMALSWREQIYLSFAAHHLSRASDSYSGESKAVPVQWNVQGQIYLDFTRGYYNKVPFSLTPGFMYFSQGRTEYLAIGTNGRYSMFIAGAWLRSSPVNKAEALIWVAGVDMGRWRAVYSYDMKLASLNNSFGSTGAHEITMALRLSDIKRRRWSAQ